MLKYLIALFVAVTLIAPLSSIGQEPISHESVFDPSEASPDEGWIFEPAPEDRSMHKYERLPGQFKKNQLGLVDPTPDVVSLQYLPKDAFGFVDWARAVRDEIIAPKGTLDGSAEGNEGDFKTDNIIIKSKQPFMADVVFPHGTHAYWLKCSVCHPGIFAQKAGETQMSMAGIWRGKYCGQCHDKVAFPIRNCFKCHSAPRAQSVHK